MAGSIDFSGPYLKTERAEQHIRELKSVFARSLRESRQALSPNRYRQLRERGQNPLGPQFPRHTPTILGDALHNLRAAIDHAYCILVKANGHTVHERSFFPIVNLNGKDTWQSRKASIEGHEKSGFGPNVKMIGVIFDEIQPFPGGNGEALCHLHALDIADKHTVLIPTVHRAHFSDVRLAGGGVIRNVTVTSQGIPGLRPAPGDTLKEGHNHKATFEICFGKVEPFEGEPILPVLEGLWNKVQGTLLLLEQRAREP